MKLSTRARYAIRMMVEFAKRAGNEPVSLGEVAESTQLPKRYLDQLAMGMKTGALLTSVRGRGGGYQLTRPAEEISLGQVTEAAIGPINVVECVLRPEVCPRSEARPTPTRGARCTSTCGDGPARVLGARGNWRFVVNNQKNLKTRTRGTSDG